LYYPIIFLREAPPAACLPAENELAAESSGGSGSGSGGAGGAGGADGSADSVSIPASLIIPDDDADVIVSDWLKISTVAQDVQTFVSTTPLTCESNLRTILDPSGLLRDQSLATTTKTHRQLDVFPNSHTRHNPRNNQHPDLSRWRRRSPS
jgi:hypothetical protein